MFAGYAGRGYYGGGAGGGSDDEDRKPDRHDLFSSFPQKGKKKTQADYDAELKIKKKRLQEANLAKLNRKIMEIKEDMVYKAIRQDDTSDEDAIVMVPSDITAVTLTTGGSNRMRSRSRSPKRRRSGRSRERRRGKRRGSPSSSPTSSSSSSSRSRSRDRDRRRRKRSHSRSRSRDRKRDRKRSRSRSRKRSRKDKKRRRSSSSSPEVVKDLSKLSRNQKNFAKPRGPVKLAMKDIGNVMKNIDRMSVAELYDFDFLPESDRVDFNASLYVTPYIVDPNDHKQLIKAPRSEAVKENIHKKHVTLRFHNAKPNVKKTESIFRDLDFPDDIDEIKISHMDGEFKFRHEIEAEEAAERQKKDMMDEIRRELPCEEDTLLMEARLKIRANPREPKTYLDFIEVEDKINERNRQFGQPSNELAQKERKVAILNQGIKKCAKSVELRIAKAEVENTEVAWANLAFDFKNSSLVWTKYIDFVMYSSKIAVDKVDNVFKKCLAEMGSVLRGECRSHKLELGTELFLYELFIRRLKFWREIGQWEQLIASIQASIEYTFFAPQNLLTSEMSHRKKMDLFRQYWESGCPRIGDRGWVSWESFDPEEWTPERSMNVEFIDVEREEGRVTRIRQKVGLRVGPPKLKRWAYLDRNVVNARCRPMRNEHYVDEHNMDAYRYVSFSDLHICELLNSQLLEVLSFAGMKIVGQDNVYPDTISLARDYGVSTEDSFLPATALKIILRICRQLAAFSPDNIQLMYSMIPSFIPILNCTKPSTKNRGTKVMARFKAYIANLKGKPYKGPKRKQKEAVESSDDEDGMDDEQPLPQYMDVDEQEHRDFKGVLTDFFAFHAYSCCTKAAKNDSSLYINFTDSVVMFRDTTLTAQMTMNAIIIAILNILDCAKKDRQKNSEVILRKLQHWMCKLAGYSDKEEEITAIRAQKAMNEVMLRTKFANDNNVTNSLSLIFPSYYSLAYCIDMWLIALRADTYSLTHIEKLTKKWTDFYKDTSGEPMGCRAVHETLLNILHRDWMWFHRGKNELYFHLKYHLDTFPFSDQPIRIATDLLAANASIVSFCHKMDQIFGNYTGGDVAETRRALAHIAVVLKKRAQIQKSIDEKTGVHDVHTINEINRYLSKVCMREADRLRDPYLWRLAMRHAHTPADFEEAYIRATKTCRFSRELHLDAIQLGDEITEQNAVKMMTEFSVRMAMTLDDVTFCEDLVAKHIAEGILKK